MAHPRSAASSSKLPARPWRGANLGFEASLWAAADALRNNMDASPITGHHSRWLHTH